MFVIKKEDKATIFNKVCLTLTDDDVSLSDVSDCILVNDSMTANVLHENETCKVLAGVSILDVDHYSMLVMDNKGERYILSIEMIVKC